MQWFGGRVLRSNFPAKYGANRDEQQTSCPDLFACSNQLGGLRNPQKVAKLLHQFQILQIQNEQMFRSNIRSNMK